MKWTLIAWATGKRADCFANLQETEKSWTIGTDRKLVSRESPPFWRRFPDSKTLPWAKAKLGQRELPPNHKGKVQRCITYMAVVVKTNGIPFWLVGEFTTHFRTYFSGDWDVHRGYDLDFDSWPYIYIYIYIHLLYGGFSSVATPTTC